MNNYPLISLLAMTLLLPCLSANAMEVAGKKLEIYGRVHVSIDSSNRDDPAITNDGTSISDNSSRLGFKGELPKGALTFIYQLEQGASVDSGDGGTLASRNSFAGIKGSFGRLIVGIHDTPFKRIGSSWGAFSDTVGDRRTVLGASYNEGNQLNERAKNAAMYSIKSGAVKFLLMHAIDGEENDKDVSGVDDNDVTMTSAAIHYSAGPLWFALGQETWDGHSKAGNVEASRAALSYKFGQTKIGLIYETIDSDTDEEWKRDVSGINAVINMGRGSLRAHYLVADDAGNQDETGATSVSLGYFHNIEKDTQVYLVYTTTDNEKQAKFQGVDGGHGDEVETTAGGSPSAVSLGLMVKF